jgi:hypothetical protein
MTFVPAFNQVSAGASTGVARARADAPERVYVRSEQQGRIRLILWGIEHGGMRSEVVEPYAPGRPSAVAAIERDLRRGVGLF